MMEEKKNVSVSPKMEEAIQLLLFSLFHYPLSFYESFCISQKKFRSVIVLKDSKKILKIRALQTRYILLYQKKWIWKIIEPEGFAFAFDITSDSFVLNVNPSYKSTSNCKPYSKISPRSKSSFF